jgi:hypothetical protein
VQRVLILEMDNYVKNSVDVRIYNLNRSGRCFCLPFSKKYGTVSRMSDGRSPQGRNLDRQHGKPVKQVFPKGTVLHSTRRAPCP